jgi:hypothetical protein
VIFVGEHSAVVRPCASTTYIVICNCAIKIPVLPVLAGAGSSGRGKEGRSHGMRAALSCHEARPVVARRPGHRERALDVRHRSAVNSDACMLQPLTWGHASLLAWKK